MGFSQAGGEGARVPRPARRRTRRQLPHARPLREDDPRGPDFHHLRHRGHRRRRHLPGGQLDPRQRRRRHVPRPQGRQGLREGRRQPLGRVRLHAPGGAPGRHRAGRRQGQGHGPGGEGALLRVRPLVRDAPAQPPLSDDALQLPLLRDRRRRVVVRRRHGHHPLLPEPRRHEALPRHVQGGVRPSRSRVLSQVQGVGRPVLRHQPPQRDARPRGHLLRRPQRSRSRGALPIREGRRQLRRAGLRAHRRGPQGRSLHGEGEGVAADEEGTVRRVQPRVRSRDRVRAQDGREDREHTDEPPGDGEVGVQQPSRAGESRGGHNGRVQAPSRVGMSASWGDRV
mmetsp:Transcript_46568/g.98828  ORF Transcript_46568/g.98828 Transcript_46568/m.98828 type:complete len:340 (-) Transcript_46568:226-1245(-)